MIQGRYLAQLIAHQLAMGMTRDGGVGSGNFGHAGRPGETGGSYSHAQVVSAERSAIRASAICRKDTAPTTVGETAT